MTLPKSPSGLYSAPDGSCIFVAFTSHNSASLRAYPWSSFGDSDGVIFKLVGLTGDSNVITSIRTRGTVHYLSLNDAQQQCNSFALDSTSKASSDRFIKASRHGLNRETSTNILINVKSTVKERVLTQRCFKQWMKFF